MSVIDYMRSRRLNHVVGRVGGGSKKAAYMQVTASGHERLGTNNELKSKLIHFVLQSTNHRHIVQHTLRCSYFITI